MFFTIFTPTYNRCYTLERLYQSLLRQSFKDFLWFIVDDGSEDNTENWISECIKEKKIEIKYIKQPNQGRYVAFNTLMDNLDDGELLVLLESDDYLKDDALKNLKEFWQSLDDTSNYCGIMAYLVDENDNIIGNCFPDGILAERDYILRDKYSLKGDKAETFRIDLAKKFRYPVYKGEKFIGDTVVPHQINEICPMALLRKKVQFHEYLKDGLTKNLRNYHMSSPNGMREYYKSKLYYEKYNKINLIKHAIGYVCYSKFVGSKNVITDSPRPLLTFLMFLPGVLYFYFFCRKEYKAYKIKA